MIVKFCKLFIALGLAGFCLGLLFYVASNSHAAPAERRLAAPGDCEVTTTADSGPNSLRGCILGLKPSATITFNTSTFSPGSPATIFVNAVLPPIITNNVTIDAGNAGVVINGLLLPTGAGLVIDGAASVVVKGLQIINFSGAAIRLQNGATNTRIGGSQNLSDTVCAGDCNRLSRNDSGGVTIVGNATVSNTILNNYIGTDVTGNFSSSNFDFGVEISGGSQFNVISGNLISGNSIGPGVKINGSNTMSNTVANNKLGTNRAGTSSLSNLYGLIIANGARFNRVEGNLSSGNSFEGIVLDGSSENIISSNFIGSSSDGQARLLNTHGLRLKNGAQRNLISGNLISGNTDTGVIIEGSSTAYNQLIGNTIGADPTGSQQVLNVNGIFIDENASHNTIHNNLISGNPLRAFKIYGDDNIVSDNIIGPSQEGNKVIGNGFALELANGAQDNLISGNLISGNDFAGVIIEDSGSMSNTVRGNKIGTDITGALPMPNNSFGVLIANGAQFNQFSDNVIAFNKKFGAAIFGAQSYGNTLHRNRVFNNGGKGIALLNNGNRNISRPALTNIGANSVSGVALPDGIVDIFSDDGLQGRYYHGTTLADAGGHFTFSQADVFTGANLAATVTDDEGNTSEFSGNGAGLLESSQQLPGNNSGRDLALSDVNRDGQVDAIVAEDSQFKVWLNNGDGLFSLGFSQTGNTPPDNAGRDGDRASGQSEIDNAQALAVGDFNRDGNVDLLLGADSGAQIWENNGSGIFFAGPVLGGANSQAVTVGDLNGDDFPDVAIGTPSGQDNQIYLNDGAGSFNFTPGDTLGSTDGLAIALGDLDQDNLPDIVVGIGGNDDSQIWLNSGSGSFSLGSILTGTSQIQAVAIGDLNQDGQVDVIIGSNSGSELWVNSGNGTFNQSQILSDTFNSQAVALGDLNSDGALDATLAISSTQTSQVWFNNGSGVLNLGQSFNNVDGQAISLGDLDNDNDLDIFLVNGSDQSDQVLINQNKKILRTGPAGGNLQATNQQGLTTTIQIAAGVLTKNTTLTYAPGPTPTQTTPGLSFAGRAFSLIAEQDGVLVSNPFSGAITVTLDYDPAEPPPEDYLLYYRNIAQNMWTDVTSTCTPNSMYIRSPNLLSVAICHLTEFALFDLLSGGGSDVFLPVVIK